MALPWLFRKLFQNDGAGDLLNKGIIPPSYVDTAAQTFTDAQKRQARANIEAVSPTGNVASSSGTLIHSAGDFNGRSIAELKQELKNFIYDSDGTATNKVFTFSANDSFITCWNNNSGTLTSGARWEVTVSCSTAAEHWAVLLFTTYVPTAFAMCVMQNGEFKDIHLVSCKKWAGGFDAATAVLIVNWKSSDGASWYRKYSDGWLEQGGLIYKGGSVGSHYGVEIPVTFPAPFNAAPPVIIHSGSSYVSAAGFVNKSTTGYTARIVNGSGGDQDVTSISWFACGY